MKTITKLFTMLALNLFTMGTMAAGPYYVNAVQAISGDGKSWNGAFKTLQEALDAATSGDQIYVAKGTYYPSQAYLPVGTPTSRHNTFKLKSGLAIYGGYDDQGNGTRDITANETILSGDLSKNDVPKGDANYATNKADNAYNVVVVTAGTTGVMLDGFTITGGYGNGTDARNDGGASHPTYYGAGILLRNADGAFKNLKIIGNVIDPNHATNVAYGGGFFISTTSANLVELDNVEFVDNESNNSGAAQGNGGAMYLAGADLKLNRLKFYNNTAKTNGGAILSSIFAGTSNIKLGNSVFYNNRASTYGGAIYFSASATVITNATIVNSTFYANQATTSGNGGAIFLVNNANNNLTLSNSILYVNTATTNADISKGANAVLTLANTITQVYNTGTNVYMGAVPQFISTSYGNADFLKLKPVTGNPAIDAGNNTLVVPRILDINNNDITETTATDLAGLLRFNGTVDLGAYENHATLPVVLSSTLSAKAKGSSVILTWATATETNNSHFILEKSIDGVNFAKIGEVSAAFNSQLSTFNYSYTDFSPANGNNYYRLTQVDNNDTKTIYNPVAVNFGLPTSDIGLKIYPNPVKGNIINVALSGYATGKYSYKLVNTAGAVAQQGSVNYNGTSSISITSNVPAGVYVLYLTSGNGIIKTKLVKQ